MSASEARSRRGRRPARRRSRSRRHPWRKAGFALAAVAVSVGAITGVLWATFRDHSAVAGGPLAAAVGAGAAATAQPPGAAPIGLPPVLPAQPTAAVPPGGDVPAGQPVLAALPEPAGDLVVPRPIPLQRDARQAPGAMPAAAEPPAAPGAVAANGQVSYQDAAGRAASARIGSGRVGEAELGLRLYPGATVNTAESTLVQDPTAGEAAATSLVTRDDFTKVADFYRAELKSARGGQPSYQEEPAAPGQLMMRSVDPATGANRTVLIVQAGLQVSVTLSRWQPPAAAAGAAAGRGG